MFENRKIKNLKRSIESLAIKYDMYLLNRQYKNTHFKTEDEYNLIQKNLSTEIEAEERNTKNLLKEWFNENFENVKFIAYDSRFICITKEIHKIGKVLLKNSGDDKFHENINKKFNCDTDFDMIIETFEELPKEIQEKFTK